jgi:hypothetical protein
MERYMKVLKSYKRMPLELEQSFMKTSTQPSFASTMSFSPSGPSPTIFVSLRRACCTCIQKSRDPKLPCDSKKEDEFLISWRELFPTREAWTEGIEALEDGLLRIFPGTLVSDLLQKYTEFNAHTRVIMANALVKVIEASDCSRPNAGPQNTINSVSCLPTSLIAYRFHSLKLYRNPRTCFTPP